MASSDGEKDDPCAKTAVLVRVPQIRECSVVLERLADTVRIRSGVQIQDAVVHKIVKECQVVLERLPDGLNTETRKLKQSSPVSKWRKVLRQQISPTKKQAEEKNLVKRLKRVPPVSNNPLHQQIVMEVTRRSARKRGRTRSSLPPRPRGSGGPCGQPPTTSPTCTASPASTTSTASPTTPASTTSTASPTTPASTTSATSPTAEQSTADCQLLRLKCLRGMIEVILEDDGECLDTFIDHEKSILTRWLDLPNWVAATYIHLLGLRGPWIRGSTLQKTLPEPEQQFITLERAGFVSSAISHCEVSDVASLLRVDELESLGVAMSIPICRHTKLALVRSFVRFHSTNLMTNNAMEDKLRSALGGCVRLLQRPRDVMERALLMLAAWLPVPRDGQRLRATRALLLRPVRALIKVCGADGAPVRQRCMFTTRQLALEWENAVYLRSEMQKAVEAKNWPYFETVCDELLDQYRTHMTTETIFETGLGVQTIGYALTEALSVALDVLKDLNNTLALKALELLLGQQRYLLERRGFWTVSLATLIQTESHRPLQVAAEVLLRELEEGVHRGASKACLDKCALALLKKNDAVVDLETKARLKSLILNRPPQSFNIVTIKATALVGTRCMKRVYVHKPPGKDQKRSFLSVEETAMAHFARNGDYPQGVDDEGETLVSLAVLALWDVVYDGNIADAWGSSCQDRPLDWETEHFWVARHDTMEQRLQAILQSADNIRSLAKDLSVAREALRDTPSLVRWDLLEGLDVEGFLKCVTISVFVAICHRMLIDFSSYRQGFPDLILWNPDESKSLFVEVKGPNDVLSTAQAQWLDFLQKLGAQVAVASVQTKAR